MILKWIASTTKSNSQTPISALDSQVLQSYGTPRQENNLHDATYRLSREDEVTADRLPSLTSIADLPITSLVALLSSALNGISLNHEISDHSRADDVIANRLPSLTVSADPPITFMADSLSFMLNEISLNQVISNPLDHLPGSLIAARALVSEQDIVTQEDSNDTRRQIRVPVNRDSSLNSWEEWWGRHRPPYISL
ncbi:hypothetical protein R1flu_005621 [Riccia fluitans]|uniref:Uncharacterized protein n=1 Tax=Riccia fluitans TaxID=41844 RepID=A0ABD1YTP4_9MARC